MSSVTRAGVQPWKDYGRVIPATVILAAALLTTSLYWARAAEPLKVAGLPVT